MRRGPAHRFKLYQRKNAASDALPTIAVLLILSLFEFPSVCSAADTPSPLRVYLFASSTCSECKGLKERLFPQLRERYGDTVLVTHVPVDDVEQFKLQLLYEKRYGVQDDEALKVFVGRTCLSGEKAIWNGLEQAIARELQDRSVTPTLEEVQASAGAAAVLSPGVDAGALAAERFSRFKVAGVALAGLVDGINPCAFTTLIFFISLLTALRKSKREVLLVGLSFAVAIFVTYLTLGVGALRAVKIVSVNSGIAKLMTWAVVALTLVFAWYSFQDFVKYRRSGRGEDLTLKLPEKIRNRIRTMISRQMRTRNIILAALVLGVAVSLLQAMCTAQVYLPVIMCLSRDRQMAPQAIGYLVLYNLMFIVPLLGVFALAYYGIASDRMAAFSRRHLGWTKLCLAVLFAGLGVALIVTMA